MKLVSGIWLPDYDNHFADHLHKEPMLNGKGTYQWKKLNAGVDVVPPEERGLAVDVGAHVGLWSHVLATMFEDVLAFEPIADHYACWARNLQDYDNADCYEAALSNEEGYIDMLIVEGNSGNACVAPMKTKHGMRRVRTFTLDGFPLERKIDFMKIDVEGWEKNVLLGGEGTIRRDKPVIVVEQKPNNAERYRGDRFDALNLLKDWGYNVVWEKAGDYCVKCT